jgi:hypothetical protein
VPLRKDLKPIVIGHVSAESPYHRSSLLRLCRPEWLWTRGTVTYAAWLLHTSGLLHGRREGDRTRLRNLRDLNPDQQDEVRARLPSTDR